MFKSFLHSGLLWLVDKKTKKIDYKQTGSERAENVPSWSWMAYEGKIRFIPTESSTKWFRGLGIRDQELGAEVALFRNGARTGERTTEERVGEPVLDSDGTEKGWIQYDTKDARDLSSARCVVIARVGDSKKCKFYILAVKPTKNEREYERIGVGEVESTIVSRCLGEVRVV